MEPSGKRANKTGTSLKNYIEHTLVDHGYQLIERDKFDLACYLEQQFYAKEYYISKSIYGTQLACDFILYHPNKHPDKLVIEAKWQQSSGSVDEKFPYFVMNIKEKFPVDTIILLDGSGCRKSAEKWLRDQIGGKLVSVLNMTEFQKWVNDGNI